MTRSRKFQRVLVLADTHCGHEVGLTPPRWNVDFAGDNNHEYRRIMWYMFENAVKALKPIDVLVANGDLIDGRGEKQGGQELIVRDRIMQAEMAVDVLKFVGAKKVAIARGTDYHTGDKEDWEDLVATGLSASRVGDVINLDINGLIIHARHHISNSQTPIGRSTALNREIVWNELWAIRKRWTLADVLLFSHVHYHSVVGIPGRLAMTTPALQGVGTRYGERRLSGICDLGIVVFDVTSKYNYTWRADIFPYPTVPTTML